MTAADPTLDPRFIAAVKLLEGTGMAEFQFRWSDDVKPDVWIAVVRHDVKDRTVVRPGTKGARQLWKAAADVTPLGAVFALCAALIDGGMCTHCCRPTSFEPDMLNREQREVGRRVAGAMNLELCHYEWDPELAVFRRGCAGG